MNKFYVTATDKFMSGWGKAKGKINKLIIECDSLEEAERVCANLKKRPEMRYVSWAYKKKPYYKPSRYVVNCYTKETAPIWFK